MIPVSVCLYQYTALYLCQCTSVSLTQKCSQNHLDFFDEQLCRETLLFAIEHETRVMACESVVVLDGFSVANYGFNTTVALASKFHRMHKAKRPDLHQVTLALFPAFECEFIGDEDDADLEFLYSKIVNPSELQREPNPSIRAKFHNQRTGVRSLAKGRGLVARRTLDGVIGNMNESPNSFVEVENFQHHVATVTWNEGYQLAFDKKTSTLEKDKLLAWMDKFLVVGGTNDSQV